jgi:HD-GYP domain-containing protein (c-di-GMP phosphodiesterase class II)
LAGEEIPLVGRIVAVADAFDSLLHERPYKPPFPMGRAIGILVEDTGTHFDPRVMDAFLEVLRGGQLRKVDPGAESFSPLDGFSKEAIRPHLQLVVSH